MGNVVSITSAAFSFSGRFFFSPFLGWINLSVWVNFIIFFCFKSGLPRYITPKQIASVGRTEVKRDCRLLLRLPFRYEMKGIYGSKAKLTQRQIKIVINSIQLMWEATSKARMEFLCENQILMWETNSNIRGKYRDADVWWSSRSTSWYGYMHGANTVIWILSGSTH